jgi:phosphoribosylformylglycinamidine cyclo-ligase
LAKKLDYHQSVNYSQADPMKVLAQKEGLKTIKNLPFDYSEVDGTRGESAYVFKMGEIWGALVQEGLGTKSLIAQAVYKQTGQSYFKDIAQDTVACIVNDLISVGAAPVALNAYWTSSSYAWLTDKKLAEDFITGWRVSCDISEVTWGGGETQSLPGIIEKDTLEFAGSAFGVINKETDLIKGSNLRAGDAIVLLESSGPHANGISLIRQIAEGLEEGYQTNLLSGQTFGEAALMPTHIYAQIVKEIRQAGIEIHYLSNITGHGWRKIMRADIEFRYVIKDIPPVHEIFDFIAKESGNNEEEMYGNYNMGAGYAVYLPPEQADKVIEICASHNLKAYNAGIVEQGPKSVVIKPKNITFRSDSLEVR